MIEKAKTLSKSKNRQRREKVKHLAKDIAMIYLRRKRTYMLHEGRNF